MRFTRKLLIWVCCLIAAIPVAWGQAVNTQSRPGILGFLDPQTGAFRPMTAAVTQ